MAAVPQQQQRRRVPDGMRVNVSISTGARVGFKHCDTFVPVPSLASTAGGTQVAGGSAAHRTAYTPATVSAANARMMDRFDVASVSCGSLAIQAPTRVLPDRPPQTTSQAPAADPSKNKAAKGKGTKGKESKGTKDKLDKTAAPPQSSSTSAGGAAAVTEADLFLSVSSYRWPAAPTAPARHSTNEPATPASTTQTATPRRGGDAESEKASTPAAASTTSGATGEAGKSATVNPLTPAEKGTAASESSSPVAQRSTPIPARDARVSALVDRGAAIVWTAHPTTFSLALVPEPTPADASVSDAPAIPLAAAPSPGTAIHAGSGPSFGAVGAVQIAAIEFSSRCTASATFTTHRNWRMATGCYDRRNAVAQQRAHEAARQNEPASMHEVFSTPAAPARAQRAQSADFSPAAASDGTQAVDGGGQHSERLGNDSETAPPVTPRAVADPNIPAAELWSIFGFINGDIVVYNHATRSVLKRHNSCRLGTRAVANAAVSTIVRVPREGQEDDTSISAASTSALVALGKHECDCATGGSSDGGKTCAHNAMTCVFGDVVVGFDNGTVLVLRLNQTGGFIDDDRAAWFGYAAITTIKPCPAHPRLLSLGCSDGIVRFVHFPSSFIVRRSDKEEADPNGSAMIAINAMTSEDAGTVNDTRLLALTRELSAHGGISALDWIPDGTGVVVGCQDDTLCLVTTAIDTYGGATRHNFSSAGAASTPSGDVAVQSISSYDQNAPAAGGLPSRSVTPQQGETQPALAGSGQPAPIYVDVRGFVRRKFHRGWVRHVCILPILSEVPARDEEPQSPSLSVTDQESVKLGGLGSRVIQATEVSHIALCAAEDGTVSVWHLPTREQTMHASPQRHSGGAPPLGMLTSNSFIANPSFATPGSRPATAGITPGTLDRNPSFVGAGGLGQSPAVSLGRQPCGSLPRLTRVLATPHTRGPAETVLDDTVLAIAPLPVSTPWWLQDRVVGDQNDSPADGGPLEFPPLFAAVTAKGSCYVWSVETPDAA